jgi:hypothetical protein
MPSKQPRTGQGADRTEGRRQCHRSNRTGAPLRAAHQGPPHGRGHRSARFGWLIRNQPVRITPGPDHPDSIPVRITLRAPTRDESHTCRDRGRGGCVHSLPLLCGRATSALRVSLAQTAGRLCSSSARSVHDAISSSVARIPNILVVAPCRRGRPVPPPGHPDPRASTGATSSSARFDPVYGVRRCHPPRCAGQRTSAPSASVPIH